MPKAEYNCIEKHIHEGDVRAAEAQLIGGLTATRMAALFAALGDPTRVRVISVLRAHELCVCDLAATLGMKQSAMSHQLRVLRQLRLVKWRRAGRQVFYTLDDDHVAALYRYGLEHVQHG